MSYPGAIVRKITQAADLALPTGPKRNPVESLLQTARQNWVDSRTKVYDIVGDEGREALTLASNEAGGAIVDLDPMTQQLKSLRKMGLQDADLNEYLQPDQVAHTYATLERHQQEAMDDYYENLGRGNHQAAMEAKRVADDLRNRIDTQPVAPFGRGEIESRRQATLGRFTNEQQEALKAAREEYLNVGRRIPGVLEGLADPKLMERLAKQNETTPYAATYRQMGEVVTDPNTGEEFLDQAQSTALRNIRSRMGASASSLDPLLKEIEGSERLYQNPVEAQARALQRAYVERARQHTAKKAIQLLAEAGETVREVAHPKEANGAEGIVTYMENGKQRHFAMPGELADVLNVSSLNDMSVALGVLGKFQRAQAKAITTWNVGFMFRNVAKDFMDTAVFVKEIENPSDLWQFTKLWGKTLRDEVRKGMYDQKADFLRRGGGLSNLQSHLSDTPLGNQLKVSRGMMGDLFGNIENWQSHLEMTPKIAAYRLLTEVKGMDPDKAAFIARTLAGSPDFGRKGMRSTEMMKFIQFWNPQIQGIARLDQFKDPKILMRKMAALTAGYLATVAYNSQYTAEDGTPEIETVPQYERDNNIILMYPDWVSQLDEKGEITSKGRVQRSYIKIPLGHAAKLLLAPIMAGVAHGMDERYAPTAGELGAKIAGGILPTNASIDPEKPLPSAAMGFLAGVNPLLRYPMEEALNQYAYLGIPIEGRRVAEIDPEYRYTPNTSEIAKNIAHVTNKFTNFAPLASPERIDHAIRTFLPGVGEIPVSIVEGLLDLEKSGRVAPVGGTRTEQIARSPIVGPVIRSLLPSGGDERRNRLSKQFYSTLDETAKAARTLSKLKNEGNRAEALQYRAENSAAIKANVRMQRLARQLAANSRKENQLINSTELTSEQKREEMAKLYQAKLNILAQAEPIAKSLR